MKNTTETSALSLLANDAGYDPLEDRLRENIRSTIEAVFEEELAQFLGRCRYSREYSYFLIGLANCWRACGRACQPRVVGSSISASGAIAHCSPRS